MGFYSCGCVGTAMDMTLRARACLVGFLLAGGGGWRFCFKTACFAKVADPSVIVSIPGLVPVSR